ncbi:MAG: hypothetical protein WAO98_00450 [Alphaproteobacteria bacterium]
MSNNNDINEGQNTVVLLARQALKKLPDFEISPSLQDALDRAARINNAFYFAGKLEDTANQYVRSDGLQVRDFIQGVISEIEFMSGKWRGTLMQMLGTTVVDTYGIEALNFYHNAVVSILRKALSEKSIAPVDGVISIADAVISSPFCLEHDREDAAEIKEKLQDLKDAGHIRSHVFEFRNDPAESYVLEITTAPCAFIQLRTSAKVYKLRAPSLVL